MPREHATRMGRLAQGQLRVRMGAGRMGPSQGCGARRALTGASAEVERLPTHARNHLLGVEDEQVQTTRTCFEKAKHVRLLCVTTLRQRRYHRPTAEHPSASSRDAILSSMGNSARTLLTATMVIRTPSPRLRTCVRVTLDDGFEYSRRGEQCSL